MFNDDSIENRQKWKSIRSHIASFLVGVVLTGIGYFIPNKTEPNEDKRTESYSVVDGNSRISNSESNVPTILPTETKTEATDPTIPVVEETNEILTTDNFNQLVEDFSEEYAENNINVTNEDLVKFVSIVNIDELAEENPELAAELFSVQTKEEYINDAAKVIGMTYMYNHNIYMKEGSTENFIDISAAVHDEDQKEKMEIVEDYVDDIAAATGDSEKVNEIVEDYLISLSDPQRELSYLDDGVGFGMQVDIALMLNTVASNDLNKENRDWLQELTSSEKYVSNIFAVYDECGNAYTNNYTTSTTSGISYNDNRHTRKLKRKV